MDLNGVAHALGFTSWTPSYAQCIFGDRLFRPRFQRIKTKGITGDTGNTLYDVYAEAIHFVGWDERSETQQIRLVLMLGSQAQPNALVTTLTFSGYWPYQCRCFPRAFAALLDFVSIGQDDAHAATGE